MTDEDKKMKVEFAPGCFDSFEGTQEELDEIIALITEMAESGELSDKASLIADGELIDIAVDDAYQIADVLGITEEELFTLPKRTLN